MGTLPADKVAQWKHDGFLSPFPLLDEEELQACRQGVERYEAWLGSTINAHPDMRWRSMPYLLLPWAARLARDPRILDKVEALLGPDILIFTSTFFIKEPHSADHRGVASGLDLLWTGAQGRGHGLDRPDRGQRSRRLHGRAVLSRQAAPLSHVSQVVKDSVNRAGQVITEPLDDRAPVPMPLKPGWFSLIMGCARTAPGPTPRRTVASAWG